MKKFFLLFFSVLLQQQITLAQTWTGATSTDWHDASNWSTGAVPTAAGDVVIPSAPANQPVISTSDAVAQSVEVQSGAMLTILSTGTLAVNGSKNIDSYLVAFRNMGTVENSGQLLIGNLSAVRDYGLWNDATVNNNPGAQISIDNATLFGLLNSGGTITNAGTFTIGSVGYAGQSGLLNNGTFNNNTGGQISVNNCSDKGLYNSWNGTFTNAAAITIGHVAGVGVNGLTNYGLFDNNTGGEIRIDNAALGLYNTYGTFTNAASITIGSGPGVQYGLLNDKEFNNRGCGVVSLSGLLGNRSRLTNDGLFTIRTSGTNYNQGFPITNNGIISYLQGNPLPNVTNNGIIASPVTGCTTAFNISGSNPFAIGTTWYKDSNLINVAGTYNASTHAFLPSGLTEGNTYTLYFAATGTNCTHTVPVTVSAVPAQPGSITGNGTVCVGTTKTYSLAEVSGATSYTWTYSGNGAILTGSGTSISITYFSSAGNGNLSVTANNGCGSSSARTLNVIVNSTPVQPGTIQASSKLICPGDTVILSAPGISQPEWNSIPATNPVDGVADVVMAVGLRKLRTDYNGPALLLRRSSDNQTKNIGFAGHDLDLNDAISFLNGSTGYCVKLYDQSGAASPNNMEQLDATKQPVLLLTGSNQRPILRFTTTMYLQNALNPGLHYSVVYAAKQNGPSRGRVLSSVTNNWLLGWVNGYKGSAFFNDWVTQGNTAANNDPLIYSCTYNGSIARVYENGFEIASRTAALSSPAGIRMNGSGVYGESSDCDFLDVIVTSSELPDAWRISLEKNIDDYYRISGLSNQNTLSVAPVNNTYYVLKSDVADCALDTVLIEVRPVAVSKVTASAYHICDPYAETVTLAASQGAGYLWNTGAQTQSITVSEPGVYSVGVSYATGCSQKASVAVTGFIKPLLDQSGPLQIDRCGIAPLRVTNYPSSNTGFTWYKNNVVIPGATASLYTAITTGSYTVARTEGNCVSRRSDAVAVTSTDAEEQTGILYVNANATGNNTGKSWADAYTDLQSALQYDCAAVLQIWVAKGTYKPTTGDDRSISFTMKNNVKILGGFNGTETNSSQRNWQLNETIISGEINDPNNLYDNSFHLFYNNGIDGTAVLDGFTLTAGNAEEDWDTNESAGAMYNVNSSGIIINCRIVNNRGYEAGAVYMDAQSSLKFFNCEFSGNISYNMGGAVKNEGVNFSLFENCSFLNNSCPGGRGGAIMNWSGGSSKIINCRFSGNSASDASAIATMYNNSRADIINCSFTGNSDQQQGTIFNFGYGGIKVNIINCSFSGNISAQRYYYNGVITSSTGDPNAVTISNCIIWGNSTGIENADGPITVTYSNVQGGYPGTGNLDVDPLFVSQPPIGLGTAGDLRLQPNSPVINKGLNSANLIPLDLAGNPRIAEFIDMGAYETPVYRSYYRDNDNDSYGNALDSIRATTQPAGYVTDKTDCNDNDNTIYPGAPELCDGKDNNCDGQVDEGFPTITYYRDADGDGFGNPAISVTAKCNPPTGYVSNRTDCNDNDNTVYPGAPEICDGKDNNCDGQIDEGFPTITYYRDADGDGYGNASITIKAKCNPPAGYVLDKTDCNDNDAGVHEPIRYYQDADRDGYGGNSKSTLVCSSVAPAGYSPFNTDCNDKNAAIYPGAPEICDGIDNNCDGQIDEGCPMVSISINDVSILEGNNGKSTLTFNVTLSQASTKAVTVNYATVNGTATAPPDYTAKSGTLTFKAGTTTQQIAISITGDKTIEPDETFTVVLSNPTNAIISKATGIGTIINDDGIQAARSAVTTDMKQETTVKVESFVKLWPNPAGDIVNLQLNGYSGSVTVKLVSIDGKQLQQHQLQASKSGSDFSMNISRYAAGTYIVMITDANGKTFTGKLVVAR